MKGITLAALFVAAPAHAAGLVVLSAGITVQRERSFPEPWNWVLGPGETFLGGELRLDIGRDFARWRMSGQCRWSGIWPLFSHPIFDEEAQAAADLSCGPAVEARLGRRVRLGAATLLGALATRNWNHDFNRYDIGAVGTLLGSLWLSVDLWHDRRGRGPLLIAEGNLGFEFDSQLEGARGGASLLAGYRF